jgi:hypothetical protein
VKRVHALIRGVVAAAFVSAAAWVGVIASTSSAFAEDGPTPTPSATDEPIQQPTPSLPPTAPPSPALDEPLAPVEGEVVSRRSVDTTEAAPALTLGFSNEGVTLPTALPSTTTAATVTGIDVVDTRETLSGWTVTATISPFRLTTDPASVIATSWISSKGRVLDVIPGITPGETGMGSADADLPRLIATAESGSGAGVSRLELDLSVSVPEGQVPGRYLSTVTIDLVGT